MKVYAIGDLHLAGGTGKTMDRFGDHWREHDKRIFEAWARSIKDDDVVLIAGDTSWAMHLPEALPDLNRIGRSPGTKVLVKGNHDYWWESKAKLTSAIHPSIKVVQSSAVVINRIGIAGTRGWLCPNDEQFDEQAAKIYEREVGRLRLALESLRGMSYDKLGVVLHYPPVNQRHQPSGFTDLIDKYGVDVCVYGHLHGEDIQGALTGRRGNTVYRLVSADAVDFAPSEIVELSAE